VRDRAAHSRKRKIVSHTFSARSIGQFEQYMHHNLEAFVRQWDKISRGVPEKNGFAKLDALTWFNYVAFDIIGYVCVKLCGGVFSRLTGVKQGPRVWRAVRHD